MKTHSEKYYKWKIVNTILNSLRQAKGVELIPANRNPYILKKENKDDIGTN